MADVITRLKVESSEYDSKIKRAAQGLLAMEDACRKVGGTLDILKKEDKDFVASLGQMETVSKDARGKINELTKAFTDLSLQYKRLTDEEKKGDFGTALKSSLDQLKTRINDTKKDLAAINQELSGSKFGQFGGVIDTIGHKMGLTANATELLTSKTALMYAGIGAGIAIVGKASDAWSKYNQELAKQDQQTNIITGLDGFAANHMTDTMRALSDTYKVDFRAAVEAANTLMSQFGKSGDEAIKLIKDGMQGMMMGEGGKMLQMIQQYAPAFRDAGVSASQLIAVIHNTQGGLFSPENMSAIVMGMKNIRLMTKQTSDALAQLGIDGQQMSRQLNDGTITVFDALKRVAGELKNVDSNSQAAGQVMQAVFGRQGAMAGTNLAKAIEELNTNLDETKRKTGELGDAFAELQTANEKLNTAIRDAFSYDGWEQMATGIKATLIDTLADVIDQLGTIKGLLAGITPGQAKQERYGTTGTPDEVKRDLEALSKADADTREAMYQGMLQKYEKRFQDVTNQMRTEQNKYDAGNRGNFVQRYNPLGLIGQWWQSTNVNTARSNVAAEQDVMNTFKREGEKIVYKVDVDTDYATKSVKQLQEELKKLARLRDEASDNGKKVLSNQYDAEISKVQAAINAKNNRSNTSTNKTPAQQAQAKFDQAEKDYNQALEAAALAVKSGQADTVAAKKKELSAAESLWKAIGDAREIYDSDAFKTAQEDAAKKVVELGGSVNTLVEEQKKAQEAARKLTAAQEKAATAYQQMQTAQANNDLKAYNTALRQYQSAQADVQRIQTEFPNLQKPQGGKIIYTVEVDSAQLEKLKSLPIEDKTIKVNVEEGEVNLPLLPKDDQTIHFNMEEGNVDLPELPDKTYTVTIEADTEEAVNKVDAMVQDLDAKKVTIPVTVEQPKPVQVPLDISYTENNMSAFLATLKERLANAELGSELYNNLTAQLADANALANLMQVAIKNGIDIAQFYPQDLWRKVFGENPGDYLSDEQLEETRKKIEDKIGKPLKLDVETGDVTSNSSEGGSTRSRETVSKYLGQLGGNVSSMVNSLEQLGIQIPDGLKAVVGGIQAVTSILSTISTIVSAIEAFSAAGSIPFFARGGIVPHAASGFTIPGNHYSGDVTPILANAGEVVLNRAQVGNIAAQLGQRESYEGSDQTYVSGEQIFLAMNNYLRRSGYGEIVTSRR